MKILISFATVILLIIHSANGQVPNNEDSLFIKTFIEADRLVAEQHHQKAMYTLLRLFGKKENPEYCSAIHKFLTIANASLPFYKTAKDEDQENSGWAVPFKRNPGDASFMSNVPDYQTIAKTFLSNINENVCGPWATKERCQVMEILAFSFSVRFYTGQELNAVAESGLDSMYMYADSMNILCGTIPAFEEYSQISKFRTYRESIKEAQRKQKAESDSIAEELKRNPTTDYLISQGNTYKGRGDYAQAMESYKKAFQVAKNSDEQYSAYSSQIDIIPEEYLPDSAIHMLQRLPSKVKLDKWRSCQIKAEIGDLYFNVGKYQQALSNYQAALKIYDTPVQYSKICDMLSRCYYKLGDLANGKKYRLMAE